MSTTSKMAMTYIAEGVSNGWLRFNEALIILDAMNNPLVIDRDLTAPPGGESDGDLYIVGTSATGDWSGEDDNFAVYVSGEWHFITPWEGQEIRVEDEGVWLRYDGSNWNTIQLIGTNYKVEKERQIENIALSIGGTSPAQSILGDYVVYSYTIGDDSVVNFRIPEDRAAGTDIVVSLRWVIDEAYATNSGEVQWRADWSATPNDSSEALDSPTHTGQVDSGDINIPATAKTIEETDLTITGTDITNTDLLGLTISRIALDDGNNPSAAEPGIVSVSVIYQSDSLGTPV